MRLGLVPLDDRPVTVALPRQVTEVAGVRLATPPGAALGHFRDPGDHDLLATWLQDEVGHLDGLVVAVDQLVHGGLVPSRLHTAPLDESLRRLEVLRVLRRARPGMPVVAFVTVPRLPDRDDATEEPEYWAGHGRHLHQLSRLLHEREVGARSDVDRELDAVRGAVPPEAADDLLRRRLRTHQICLQTIELAAEGVVDDLLLAADDTAPVGLPRADRSGLLAWVRRFGLERRVQSHAGADEVACTLLLGLVHRLEGRRPRVAVTWGDDDGRDRVAPYEDEPVAATVAGQLRAVGAQQVWCRGDDGTQGADLVLGVHPPAGAAGDWALGPPPDPAATAAPARALIERVEALQRSGSAVAVADVAYPNGADPVLVGRLVTAGLIEGLAGYAAWNTAGNSTGSVLATGLAAVRPSESQARVDREAARLRLLARRLLEDWAYMTEVRTEARGLGDVPVARVEQFVAEALERRRGGLGGLGDRVRLLPGSVRLPWGRAFEVDFDLELVPTHRGAAEVVR